MLFYHLEGDAPIYIYILVSFEHSSKCPFEGDADHERDLYYHTILHVNFKYCFFLNS